MIVPTSLAAAGDPLGHVLDKDGVLGPFSMNTLSMFLVGVILIVALTAAAKRIAIGPESEGTKRYITRNPLCHMLEVIIEYLRANVIKPQLGGQADRHTPFLLTLFFFILFNNLFGLIPLLDIQHLIGMIAFDDSGWAVIGGTPTGRLAVNGALALTAFLLWQVNGLISSGFGGWAKHFLGGAPWYLAPIMLPVELMGTIVKPAALTVRLFANMTAGHTLLAMLTIFTSASLAGLGVVMGAPVAIVAFLGALAIFFLEIFVAFLQAFIFMFLTTLFIAQMAHHHHDDHAGATHYDEDHPAIDDAAAPVTSPVAG
jgi:F-type H+-transporting ATPase subunit a